MRNYYWGFLLMGFGFLMLLDNLDVMEFGDVISNFWPLLLILWGVSILIRRGRSEGPAAIPLTPTASFDVDLLHQSSVFDELTINVSSRNFKGGSASTVFGSSYLDLSAAEFAEGDHQLKLQSVFGDVTVVVALDAAVAISASGVFSSLMIFDQRRSGISTDIRTQTTPYETSIRKLHISVSNVFGDVRVVTKDMHS